MDDERKLCLLSPFGGPQAVYNWPMCPEKLCSKPDGSIEIIETIRWVFEDLPDLREAIRDELSEFTIVGDMKNYDSMKSLCEKYNSALAKILTETGPLRDRRRASAGLLKHILTKSYNQAVEDPERLNEYKSWSPEVYGETSFDFIAQLLDTLTLSPDDVFIDLGSGVGQVVLQVAASVPVKLCIGIEKADVPFRYSQQLDRHFRFWMQWFGKVFSPYDLQRGDFFEPQFRSQITNATVIFVNNYAFGPKVDHDLKVMFEDLKDGARIFSSKAFSPVNFRITDRNLNDIGSVLNVRELQPAIKGSVSWTDNSVSYYCHTVDRTKLEKYFNRMKNTKKVPSPCHACRQLTASSSCCCSCRDSVTAAADWQSEDKSSCASSSSSGGRRVRSNGSDASTDCSNDDSSSTSSSSPPRTTAATPSRGKEHPHSNGHQHSNGGKKTTTTAASGTTGRDSSPVFFGPTTRRAWKEQTSDTCTVKAGAAADDHPLCAAKSAGDGKVAAVEASPTPSDRVSRKRSKERPENEAKAVSTCSSGNEENVMCELRVSAEVVPPVKKGRGRPRKVPVATTATAAAAVRSLKRASRNGTVAHEPRRPGRPPSKKTASSSAPTTTSATGDHHHSASQKCNQLQTLHDQTLLSINQRTGKRLSPAPGCVDRKLCSSPHDTATAPSLPSVIITDSCDLSVSEKLDQIMSAWKRDMHNFLSYMQMPVYREKLAHEIQVEKTRKQSLESQVQAMERSISSLQEKGTHALKAKLSQLGISATTAEDVLSVSKSLIEQNKQLAEKEMQLQAQVSREELVYQEICQCYEKDFRDKEMDRRLFSEIASNMEKKRRLSIDVEKLEHSVTHMEKMSTAASTPSPSTSTLSSLSCSSPRPDVRPVSYVRQSVGHIGRRCLIAPQTPTAAPQTTSPCVPDASHLTISQLQQACIPTSQSELPVTPPSLMAESTVAVVAPKDHKQKKETKKRLSLKREAKGASPSPSAPIAQVSDPNIVPKSPRGDSCPSAAADACDPRPPPQQSSADKERLTLTFVINRETNSASVKSPVKERRNSGSSAAPTDRSPLSGQTAKRKSSSASNASSHRKKKNRSSRSSGPDTSSESETKLKIKFGCEAVVDRRIASPAAGDKTAIAVVTAKSLGANNSVDHSVAANASLKAAQESSRFDRLLEIAASERELNNRREQERLLARDSPQALVTQDVSRPPSHTSASVPPSPATAAASHSPFLFDGPFAKPMDSVGKGQKSPAVFPFDGSDSGAGDSSHLSPALLPHLLQRAETATSHPHVSSLQSIKNMASLSSSFIPMSQPPIASQPQPKRKPGRPPKKSISESWASCQESAAQTQASSQSSPSCVQGRSANHRAERGNMHQTPPLMHPSYPSCQVEGLVAPHGAGGHSNGNSHHPHHHPLTHNSLHHSSHSSHNGTHFGSNDESIDYSVVKGRNGSFQQLSTGCVPQSSVIQSSAPSRTSVSPLSRQSVSNRSADFAGSNFYGHTGATVRAHPYPGNLVPSSSAAAITAPGQQMSVIRRHESTTGFAAPPMASSPSAAAAYYGILSSPAYPHLPFESFQKEFHRYNVMQSLASSPKKLLRPSPLDSVCRRS